MLLSALTLVVERDRPYDCMDDPYPELDMAYRLKQEGECGWLTSIRPAGYISASHLAAVEDAKQDRHQSRMHGASDVVARKVPLHAVSLNILDVDD